VLAEDLIELFCANVRTPDVRRADLRAQIAANKIGADRIAALAAIHGRTFLRLAFAEIIAYGARQLARAIGEVPDGTYRARGEIEGDGVSDSDIPIEVAITVSGEQMLIDFTNTAGPVAGNINCPRSVAQSSCLFALRAALNHDLMMNIGDDGPIEWRFPNPSLIDAHFPAAVVAGNVETSQRVADVVLAALGQVVDLPAAGQGTMNNVIIGASNWTYYETIGGGQGASSRGDGPSGVHVGMSNTLNTPIEAIEMNLPLRVESYELRYGTGGTGKYRGGDGIERRLKVLSNAMLSVITDRRRHAPQGKAGGHDGAMGENLLDDLPLPAKASLEVRAGQIVTIRTPGGGGFGSEHQDL
jgi:N-methylhydantoinase B